MLDDPTYSDVEFVLPSRLKRGVTKRIYANQKMLSRAEYFDTSRATTSTFDLHDAYLIMPVILLAVFKSGFAEAGERDLASLTNRSSGVHEVSSLSYSSHFLLIIPLLSPSQT